MCRFYVCVEYVLAGSGSVDGAADVIVVVVVVDDDDDDDNEAIDRY